MNNTVSLPDLYTTTQRFFGIEPRSHFATMQGLRPGPRGSIEVPKGLYQTFCVYMRNRQMVWDEQAQKQRIPARTARLLHGLETECAAGLRQLNPYLFQRFDDKQLLKILRSVPIGNYAKDTWIFSRDPKVEDDPPAPEYYFIVHGEVDVYERSPKVSVDCVTLRPGDIFAEGGFPTATSAVRNRGAGAQAKGTVLVIVMSKMAVGQSCQDDRLIADKKYANILQKMQAFQEIKIHKLEKWLELAQIFHVPAGQELLSWPQVEDSFLIFTANTMQWCADIHLVEMQNPDKEVSRRKIHIFAEAAIGLQGGSIFDKLDPYLIVRLSPQKRFQTATMNNAGKDPYFNHHGVLVYDQEPAMEVIVYDYNEYGTHEILGQATIPASEFTTPAGFEGEVQLFKPGKTSIWSTKSGEATPAGVLLLQITWGAPLGFRSVTKHKEPRQRSFPKVALLDLQQKTYFGHEAIILGGTFFDNLQRATASLGFTLSLSNFHIRAKQEGPQMTKSTVIRIPRQVFEAFLIRVNKQKDFLTEAVNSSLEKQVKLRETCHKLILKWDEEERRRQAQMSMRQKDPSTQGLDVNVIRSKLRGAILTVRVVSAVGLGGPKQEGKLDPYLIIKVVGTNAVVQSAVYEDASSSPQFDFEARFRYNGETVVDVTIMDKDRFSKDEVLGTCSLTIEQFHDGFVGAMDIRRPASLSKNAGSAGTLMLEIEWSDIPGA
jgi:hypothetical protein